MKAPTRQAKWREVKRRPVQGNPPDDRILRGPDCHRPKRVCADPFPVTPRASTPEMRWFPGVRFPRHSESIAPMELDNLGVGGRLPLVGSQAPVQERDERNALCSSSTMSSGRLFLDRVGRHQSPSPLHRHGHNNTHSMEAPAKDDISTLPVGRHFYFALTHLR